MTEEIGVAFAGSETEALEKGMSEKSKEFAEKGSELYAKA